jgi:hypothetical protein
MMVAIAYLQDSVQSRKPHFHITNKKETIRLINKKETIGELTRTWIESMMVARTAGRNVLASTRTATKPRRAPPPLETVDSSPTLGQGTCLSPMKETYGHANV